MTPELARAALQFLQRTQLQGGEVPAFVEVVNALNAIANPPPAPEQES
jgi:hypothetical protein